MKLAQLFPYEYTESIFTINYQALFDKGFRGIIFDVDNTLVPHGDDSNEHIDAFLGEIAALGFALVLLSDNDAPRLERFTEYNGVPYICDAEKPSTKGYVRALQALNVPKEQVVYIGDQLFTDVLGANNAGIASILVKYIGYYDKGWKGKRRAVEAAVLSLYRRSKRHCHRLGNILIEG